MATSKATTTSDVTSGTSTTTGGGDELSGASLKTDDDQRTAELSVDDRKTSTATLPGGTKITGPSEVVNKLKR